ncbi:MAG: NADPH-dependent FMN reductase [Mycobacteriales bacterium]|nr:MAG: hypothetical protein DLM56_15170 [Pseudonocardiales bacterium]
MTKFLAVGGGMRSESLSSAILRHAAELAHHCRARAQVLTVRELALPMFDPDVVTRDDPAVRRLLEAVEVAETLLIATPIYGGTPSGAVKNLLDTLHLGKRDLVGPLHGKRVTVAAVGGGALASSYSFQRGATGTLEIAAKNLGAWVDPHHVEFSELQFDPDGSLGDVLARNDLLTRIHALLGASRRMAV